MRQLSIFVGLQNFSGDGRKRLDPPWTCISAWEVRRGEILFSFSMKGSDSDRFWKSAVDDIAGLSGPAKFTLTNGQRTRFTTRQIVPCGFVPESRQLEFRQKLEAAGFQTIPQ